MTNDEVVALETMIDRMSLQTVLEHLMTICGEKAEHVRTNWQDEGLAQDWEKAGLQIDAVAEKMRYRSPGIAQNGLIGKGTESDPVRNER